MVIVSEGLTPASSQRKCADRCLYLSIWRADGSALNQCCSFCCYSLMFHLWALSLTVQHVQKIMIYLGNITAIQDCNIILCHTVGWTNIKKVTATCLFLSDMRLCLSFIYFPSTNPSLTAFGTLSTQPTVVFSIPETVKELRGEKKTGRERTVGIERSRGRAKWFTSNVAQLFNRIFRQASVVATR